jgi:hypothetical protein
MSDDAFPSSSNCLANSSWLLVEVIVVSWVLVEVVAARGTNFFLFALLILRFLGFAAKVSLRRFRFSYFLGFAAKLVSHSCPTACKDKRESRSLAHRLGCICLHSHYKTRAIRKSALQS